MKRLTLLTLAASALALTACASLAPYGPQAGPNGQGYAEQRIESNRFRVTYRGVGAPGPVADMALLRAADLTVQTGVGVGVGLNLSGPQPTSTALEVVMGNGPRPDRPEAYDARDVQMTLRGRR